MSTYNGILNINKPAGWTLHDVVAWVRRVLHEQRVGHAGTLDPLATGVLLVCVGQATRIVEYLMAGRKVYRAEALLGIITDTYDTDGEIVATSPVPELTQAEIKGALAPFIGDTLQTPPIYSALKQDGVPLHRRARRGEEVRPEPRPVRIHSIEVIAWQSPRLTLEVTCDPGTYIRSLVYDLGQALGCGATMSGLIRAASGQFTVADAIGLDALAEAHRGGTLDRSVHPLTDALHALVPVPVDPDTEQRIRNGQFIPCPARPSGDTGYAVDADGAAIAILIYDAGRAAWRPEKVFAKAGA